MTTAGYQFYATSALDAPFTRADVLAGRVIRLSPALITITDGRINQESTGLLQREILAQVDALAEQGVCSWHVDITFGDYGGVGARSSDRTDKVFTPDFVDVLAEVAAAYGGFVTVHLLTADPLRRLRAFDDVPLGAVCFQLDAVPGAGRLADLVAAIGEMGACPSPVIETVGTETLVPAPPAEVRAQLEPVLPQIGMLTVQAAGTGARANRPAGAFARQPVIDYLDALRPAFTGTLQVQGGITTATVGAAVRLGAEFLVTGTQLFRQHGNLTPVDVARAMWRVAADALGV